MTDDDTEPQHRAYYQPDARDVDIREDIEDEDGVFVVRMPVASTGEVRNQGDDPLSRDALRGMRDQINDGGVGVFLDHGANPDVGGSRYSAVGKLGEWRNADLVTPDREDGTGERESTLLVADARLMDPDTLPRIPSRGALGAIKSQVERNLGLASSIGWREDETFRGGVDLMEASIVGIPADPRTTSGAEAAETLARAASMRDVDPEQLVDEFRAVVMGPDADVDTDTDDDDDDDVGESADTTRETTMTDDDSGDEQPDETHEQNDWRERMLDMQERQLETLNALADALRESDEDDEDDEDDDMDDEDEEQSADTDDTETQSEDGADDGGADDTDERSFEIDGEEVTADDIRAMRDQLADADVDVPDTESEGDERDADANADEQSETDDPLARFGLGGGW